MKEKQEKENKKVKKQKKNVDKEKNLKKEQKKLKKQEKANISNNSNNYKNETKNFNTNKINSIKIFIAIIFIILVTYAVFSVGKLIKNPSNTFIVSNGTLSKDENAVGYISREETIVETNNSDAIIKIKEEGKMVAKGDAIFRYASAEEEKIKQQIADLDVKIQQALESGDTTPLSGDKKLLENQITNEIDTIYKVNNLEDIKEHKKNINLYITKKAKIIGDKSPAGSYLKQLISEREEYEKQIESQNTYIAAPVNGAMSYRIDNLESSMAPTNLAKLDKNFLESLNLKTNQTTVSSDTKGKIVNNYYNYLIFNSNSDEAKSAKVKDKINIIIQNNKITGTIENIINENDKSQTIAIKIENKTEDLLAYRKISFDIIWWNENGFRIPNSAIKKVGDINYVIRNRNGYLNKMAVKILKQNGDFAIVETLTSKELQNEGLTLKEISNLKTITLYDEILLNPTQEQLLQ